MIFHDNPPAIRSQGPDSKASEITIAQLVSEVYEAASLCERSCIIRHLLRPLGLLALVGVADGVFAKLWLRNPTQGLQIQIEDALSVGASDIVALVEFVQQVSVETIDGLSQIVATSPTMATSVAAELLVMVLMWRLQYRRYETGGNDNSSSARVT